MALGSHHHRKELATVRETAIGKITVTALGIEAKAGASPFQGRHTVFVINDSSKLLFLKIGGMPDLTTGDFIIAFSGEAITFNPDPDQPQPIFVKIEEGSVDIRVIEVR